MLEGVKETTNSVGVVFLFKNFKSFSVLINVLKEGYLEPRPQSIHVLGFAKDYKFRWSGLSLQKF